MLNLLIVDSSDDFRTALSRALQKHFRIHCCTTGKEALSQCLLQHPDVLVLDLMLPELDGFSLLQALHEAHIHPAVLATTRLVSDYIVERSEELNVGYLIVKPCDAEATARRVLELSEKKLPDLAKQDPRLRLGDILQDLGFSVRLKGFVYLQEAILLMMDNPNQSITKELYPAVGIICNSSGSLVERSIRNAVDNAWKKRDENIWQQYFRADASGTIPRPSNSVFISALAKPLREAMR